MRDRKALVFALVLAGLGVWALAQTVGWPVQAWLYPRVIAVPLIALAITETALLLRGRESVETGPAVDVTLDSSSLDPAVMVRRTLGAVAWIGGFLAAILLVGFQAAVPVFVFSYLRLAGREGWMLSAVLAGLSVLVFHLLFVTLLHLPLPPGLLWKALGR